MSLYIQAAGQKWGQVVSKKWCDSCVQLRLDPFLDKITQGAATWCPLHCSVSPITPSISYSVSLFIWTGPFFFSLSLNPVFLPTFSLSLSLYLSQCLSALHTGSTYYRMVISVQVCDTVTEKDSQFYLFLPPQTPSCCKNQPDESDWDAIRDAVHIFDINFIDSLFLYLILWFFPPHTPTACTYSHTCTPVLMTILPVLMSVRDCNGR